MTRFKLQPFYTTADLAGMLEISRERVIRLMRRHEVRMQKVGARWLIPLSEITEKLHWLRESMEQRDIIQDSYRGRPPI